MFRIVCFKLFHENHVCKQSQLSCVKKVKPDNSKCAKSCEGILVTSYIKDDIGQSVQNLVPRLLMEYDKYKIHIQFPPEIKGVTLALFYTAIAYIFTIRASMEKQVEICPNLF